MLELATLSAIAGSAVTVLTPLLGKAVEKNAEELGESAMTSLLDKLKQRAGTPWGQGGAGGSGQAAQ